MKFLLNSVIQRTASIILICCFLNLNSPLYAQSEKDNVVIKVMDRLIAVDMGNEDNLEKGTYILIYRPIVQEGEKKNVYIGIIQINQVHDTFSFGEVVYKSKYKEIKVLDNATLIDSSQIEDTISLLQKKPRPVQAKKIEKKDTKWYKNSKLKWAAVILSSVAAGYLIASSSKDKSGTVVTTPDIPAPPSLP